MERQVLINLLWSYASHTALTEGQGMMAIDGDDITDIADDILKLNKK